MSEQSQKTQAVLNREFYESLKSRAWRAPILCPPLYDLFKPHTVIDAGCGCGDLLNWFREKGCDVRGIEISNECRDVLFFPPLYLVVNDLTETAPHVYGDLLICFLVGEYIPPEKDPIFVRNLTKLSRRIAFASTTVNAWGGRIVNCKPNIEWEKQFRNHGYVNNSFAQRWLRHKWEYCREKPMIKMIYENLLVMERP